jgi:hypothetical protein
MFLSQDETCEKELIIYNTDTEYPLSLSRELEDKGIVIINNNTNLLNGEDYSNVGDIRRDALLSSKGEYYICWDDDDIFLPWNIRQCLDGISGTNFWAWKPKISLFWQKNKPPKLANNVMEASFISLSSKIKEIGFLPHKGGGEHLSWFQTLSKEKKMKIEDDSIPGYCFNWSDSGIIAGHKQSGSIDRVDNFTFHKENTKDIATRPLSHLSGTWLFDTIRTCTESIIQEFQENGSLDEKRELLEKYIEPHCKNIFGAGVKNESYQS